MSFWLLNICQWTFLLNNSGNNLSIEINQFHLSKYENKTWFFFCRFASVKFHSNVPVDLLAVISEKLNTFCLYIILTVTFNLWVRNLLCVDVFVEVWSKTSWPLVLTSSLESNQCMSLKSSFYLFSLIFHFLMFFFQI